jgi:hypothetical protein
MKKMLYRDDDSTYEAVIGPCKTGDRITISRTQDQCWTPWCRGERVAQLTDTGNGVKIKLSDKDNHGDHKPDIKVSLDYAQIFELKMLLDGYVLDGPGKMGDGVQRYELKED